MKQVEKISINSKFIIMAYDKLLRKTNVGRALNAANFSSINPCLALRAPPVSPAPAKKHH